jgi:alkanesulfonate monooxygenase SsuD/methylene tetrahydromethanopterin reductase-like flavin-dependent oxidoreductase (luciferase family)
MAAQPAAGRNERSLGLIEYLDASPTTSTRQRRQTAFTASLLAEEIGYGRLWIPEHHSAASPSTNPIMLAGALGARTSRIRLGTAVSLLRVRDPHLTAEDVVTAAALCGDRFDLGFGRGNVGGSAARALGYLRKDDQQLEAAIEQVVSILDEGTDWIEPIGADYQLWLHGAGSRSAVLAGKLGFSYCHALFLNPDIDVCERQFAEYRTLAPNSGKTAVALTLIANPDPVRAMLDAFAQPFHVNCAGTAADCARTVVNALRMTGADEVIIAELSSAPDDHFRALADVFALASEEVAQSWPTSRV